MKNIAKLGSLITKINSWSQEPGRFKFFSFPLKVNIMLVLIVKIEKQ